MSMCFRVCLGCVVLAFQCPAQDGDELFSVHIRPFFGQWCSACHEGDEAEGKLDLEIFQPRFDSIDDLGKVRRIRDHLRGGTMPPPKKKKPPRSEVVKVLAWASHVLAKGEDVMPANPGRVTVRRLSRFEYDNTVLSLFGFVSGMSESFPGDDLGYGFDNIGDALTTSLLHVERYAAAAEDIAHRAISTEDPQNPPTRRREAEAMPSSREKSIDRGGDFVNLFSRTRLTTTVDLPRQGIYRVRIRTFATRGGDELAKIGLSLDGVTLEELEVQAERGKPETLEVDLPLPGGRRSLGFEFLNDYYDPKAKDPRRRDRNLYMDWIEVVGPVDQRPKPQSHQWIFEGDKGRGRPGARSRRLIDRLASRAWRRPARAAEIRRLCRLVEDSVETGRSFEVGMQVALQAILVSPHFLFRLEPGGRGTSGRVQKLDPWALASRLSYFLWSAPPDAHLVALAKNGRIGELEVLESEVERMLGNARADALAENFLSQWLELRNLQDITPDPERFPLFDEELRESMLSETVLFFRWVMREGLGVSSLVDSRSTFLNERLARHYGVSGVTGDEFRLVALSDPRRGGFLGHASVHAVTSNPTRTSPVRRGKWILENLLDAPPPPPPPGADSFDEEVVRTASSLREQMQMHRRDAKCANCHTRMDVLGLALENYDAIGRWRDRDGNTRIDASGVLPDGRKITGPADLKTILGGDRAFLRCLLRKMFIYAVGRDATRYDELALDRVVNSLGRNPTVAEVVLALVKMDAFRKRKVTR